MENNDWQKKGNDFWKVVQDAVNSGNYQQLNQQVRNTIDDTVEGICNGMQGIGNEWRQAWQETGNSTANYRKSTTPGYQTGTRRMREEQKQLPAVYMKNPPGQVSGTLMAVTGYTLTGVFAVTGLLAGIILAVEPSVTAGVITGMMAAATVVSVGVGVIGSRTRKLIKRFKNYTKQIGNRAYCTIEELSSRTGRDKEEVIKDLKKMIQKKMFLQGHLDQQETCVIVTDEMYQQYLTVQQQAHERQLQQKAAEEQRAQLPEECQKILEEGQEYIRYIRKCNDDIPGEEISQKLSRLELIITRIFAEVSKNPSLAGDLRKFMNYYLPTTRKLVDAYRDLDQEPIAGESIIKTKKEIEDTLDTINQAFENLLNSFFEEKAMDISSDISVLHTMLAQEGLTGNDFNK
ncbi:MAG: 5-bromo-4-chloroindolyl phosphate hydrolysis family protein [Oliverpabstia sp.]